MRSTRFILGLVLLAACSKDSTGPGSNTEPGGSAAVTMKGILVGGTLSGDIDLTIAANAAAAVSVGVTGCVYLGSATCVAATGTYNTGSKALGFTTSGPSLTFSGTYASGKTEGSFTGADNGNFVIRTGTATTYCGTFAGDAAGTWNFVISGSSLNGAYDDGSGASSLSGTVNGSALAITFVGGTAAGTLSGSSASGTWTAAPDAGTWSGSNVNCRT